MPLIDSSPLTGGTVAAPAAATVGSLTVSPSGLPSGAVPYPTASGGASFANNYPPLSATPLNVLASLTDGGRVLMARMLVEGLAFKIVGFRVGRGGYDPHAPASPTAIDTTLTELESPFFPAMTLAVETIDRFEQANDQSAAFLCRVASGECLAGVGEFGVYSEITASPTNPAEIGDQALFAVCHRPFVGKTLQDVLVWRLVVQF